MRSLILLIRGLFILLVSLNLHSAIEDYSSNPLVPTSSNYGETGLFEIPTARFMDEGTLKFGISSSYPNSFTYFAASPFSWAEAVYRYTELKNQKYGPFNYSGNQTLKDKGFDLKLKLLDESYYLPAVALGFKDVAGTGRFSSEYIVGSKRFGDLDLTMGIGWGLLGTDENISNPMIAVDESFRLRADDTKLGGSFRQGVWFSGDRAAIFGGLEYSLLKYGVKLKMEYDTTNPDIARYGPPIEVRSRINLGLSRSYDWADLSLGLERGSEIRFAIVLKGIFGSKDLVPKLDRPLKVTPLNKEQKEIVSKNKDILYKSMNRGLRQEDIYIQGATYEDNTVEVVIAQSRFRSFPRAAGRAARIVSALSPDDVEEIEVHTMNGDLEVTSVTFSREKLDKGIASKLTASELLQFSDLDSDSSKPNYLSTNFQPTVSFPEFSWNMTPALRHQIGGPEAFYLGQLWWKVNSTLKLRRGLTIYNTLGMDIYNNFDQFNNASKSSIQHVRSDIQDYLSEGENNIARLKLDYIWSPYKDLFARFDIGYLEEMFGGIGGELYYRPFNSKFSAGITLHKVKQRNYDQKFSFRDYTTETGHLGLYYDWPNQVQSHILVGKYLAGDKGATIDLSRRFKTGFTLGIFATMTNLSPEEFGEGGFDKGFYFQIPMDILSPKYGSGHIPFGMHPLTKDGGALLNYHNSLYGLLGDTNKSSWLRDWQDILD